MNGMEWHDKVKKLSRPQGSERESQPWEALSSAHMEGKRVLREWSET